MGRRWGPVGPLCYRGSGGVESGRVLGSVEVGWAEGMGGSCCYCDVFWGMKVSGSFLEVRW